MTASAATPPEDAPAFRLDNDQLAFRFTATLSDRYGTPVERLPVPGRLDDWLAAGDLAVGGEQATTADLASAHRLREAIHRLGTAIARDEPMREEDRELLNALLREDQLCPQLTEAGLSWRPAPGRHVRGALSRIAHDAVMLFGGPQRGRVKTCENPECQGLYVDTSQGRNRRWCSMNVCGNRAKKARFRGPRTTTAAY
ncbi:CGNR zinc finger domain-containing protein [Brevibacterium album]|uniref:CGNR zinc finger domain-containing protein n=1 Tax=Brevibacterium album TaxID=417948 RepID=UPI0004902129|nr:ABATE domain-containing protein [Brevibacterium album]